MTEWQLMSQSITENEPDRPNLELVLSPADAPDVFDDTEAEDKPDMVVASDRVAALLADPLKHYFKAISRTPLLTAEQEVDLSKRIEAGQFAGRVLSGEYEQTSDATPDELQALVGSGAAAKNHMLEANLRLVVSIAKRYTGHGMEFLDIIEEGNIGLIRAVEKFDYTKGFKFSTYATRWIRQNITRAMADKSRTIRLPVHVVETMNAVRRVENELELLLGRQATPEEIGSGMALIPERVFELKMYSRDPFSLDKLLAADGDTSFGDLLPDHTAVDPLEAAGEDDFSIQMNLVLSTLSEREAGILRMRYGLNGSKPSTFGEIGKVYNLTRERIRQLELKAMAKLRQPDTLAFLEAYI